MKPRHKQMLINMVKAACIVALSVAFTYVLIQPLSFSIQSLLSTEDRSDFTITDFYNAIANSRLVSKLNTDVVVVDIANSDREEIAQIVDVLSYAKPAVVGLDVIFDAPGDSTIDNYLMSSLANLGIAVMAMSVNGDDDTGFAVEDKSFFDGQIPGVDHAVVSLPTKFDRGVIRQFRNSFAIGSDTVLSFPLAIVEKFAPEEVQKCIGRGNVFETINYPSEVFEVIEPENLGDRLDDLNGKIVLLGSIDDPADVHSTPIDARLSGILVHAHSIATILNESYYSEVSGPVTVALGLALCYLFVLMSISVSTGLKGILTRLVQVTLLYLLVLGGYSLFVHHAIVVDFSYTFMMIAFGAFSVDVWIGSVTLFKIIKEKIKTKNNKE